MPAKLYKCSGFSDDCWLENQCVIKSTFLPYHIWNSSGYVKNMVRNGKTLKVKCAKDNELKEVKPCLLNCPY